MHDHMVVTVYNGLEQSRPGLNRFKLPLLRVVRAALAGLERRVVVARALRLLRQLDCGRPNQPGASANQPDARCAMVMGARAADRRGRRVTRHAHPHERNPDSQWGMQMPRERPGGGRGGQ